jgi:hypothetical protein
MSWLQDLTLAIVTIPVILLALAFLFAPLERLDP